MMSKLAAMSANLFPTIAPNPSTSPIPSFGQRQVSLPKPHCHPHQYQSTQQVHTSLPLPLRSHATSSDTTSPTSSASLPTPTGMINDTVKIVSCHTSPGLLIAQQVALDYAYGVPAVHLSFLMVARFRQIV